MLNFFPRAAQRIPSLALSTLTLTTLAACGGGGSDTTNETIAAVVRIDSANGCSKAVDAATCTVTATVTVEKLATVTVAGQSVDVQPGVNKTVSIAVQSVGLQTVVLANKDGSGQDQAVVEVKCDVGLTHDTTTNRCVAPAPVYGTYYWGIGGQFDTFFQLTSTGVVPVVDLTGQNPFNCGYLAQQVKARTKGSCTSRNAGQPFRVPSPTTTTSGLTACFRETRDSWRSIPTTMSTVSRGW